MVIPERCHCGAAMEFNTRTHRLQCPVCQQGRVYYDMTPASLDQGPQHRSSRPKADMRPAQAMTKWAYACLRGPKEIPVGAHECVAQELLEIGFTSDDIRGLPFVLFEAAYRDLMQRKAPVSRVQEHTSMLKQLQASALARGLPDPLQDPLRKKSEAFRKVVNKYYEIAPALFVGITGGKPIKVTERKYQEIGLLIMQLLQALDLVTQTDEDGGTRMNFKAKWLVHRALELLDMKQEAVEYFSLKSDKSLLGPLDDAFVRVCAKLHLRAPPDIARDRLRSYRENAWCAHVLTNLALKRVGRPPKPEPQSVRHARGDPDSLARPPGMPYVSITDPMDEAHRREIEAAFRQVFREKGVREAHMALQKVESDRKLLDHPCNDAWHSLLAGTATRPQNFALILGLTSTKPLPVPKPLPSTTTASAPAVPASQRREPRKRIAKVTEIEKELQEAGVLQQRKKRRVLQEQAKQRPAVAEVDEVVIRVTTEETPIYTEAGRPLRRAAEQAILDTRDDLKALGRGAGTDGSDRAFTGQRSQGFRDRIREKKRALKMKELPWREREVLEAKAAELASKEAEVEEFERKVAENGAGPPETATVTVGEIEPPDSAPPSRLHGAARAAYSTAQRVSFAGTSRSDFGATALLRRASASTAVTMAVRAPPRERLQARPLTK